MKLCGEAWQRKQQWRCRGRAAKACGALAAKIAQGQAAARTHERLELLHLRQVSVALLADLLLLKFIGCRQVGTQVGTGRRRGRVAAYFSATVWVVQGEGRNGGSSGRTAGDLPAPA